VWVGGADEMYRVPTRAEEGYTSVNYVGAAPLEAKAVQLTTGQVH